MPALLTRISGVPKASRVFCTIRATEVGSVTSVGTKTACAPLATSSADIAAPVSGLSSATTTRAPSAAKQRAVAAPMPWPAPVTIAILPFRRSTILSPIDYGSVRQHGRAGLLDLGLEGMARRDHLIDFDAQSRLFRNLPVAFGQQRQSLEDFAE